MELHHDGSGGPDYPPIQPQYSGTVLRRDDPAIQPQYSVNGSHVVVVSDGTQIHSLAGAQTHGLVCEGWRNGMCMTGHVAVGSCTIIKDRVRIRMAPLCPECLSLFPIVPSVTVVTVVPCADGSGEFDVTRETLAPDAAMRFLAVS